MFKASESETLILKIDEITTGLVSRTVFHSYLMKANSNFNADYFEIIGNK